MFLCYLNEWIYDNNIIFSPVGGTFLAILILSILWIFFEGIRIFLLPRLFPRDLKQYGKWAVVTGSTDGIGKAYAFQLASRGMDIILISRNHNKLVATAQELRMKYYVNVEIIQADFSRGWDLYEDIYRQLAGKEIGILVNNVGILEPQPCYFLSMDIQKIVDIVNINIVSVIMMTYMILPQMQKREKGAIVTMSSITALVPLPVVSVYGSTKSFSNLFSTALTWENSKPAIHCQTLVSSIVQTNLTDFTNIWKWFGALIPYAEAYSNSAISTLSVTKHTTGYLGHYLHYIIFLLPKVVLYVLSLRLNKEKRNNPE